MALAACSGPRSRIGELEEITGIALPAPMDVFVNEEMDESALDRQHSIHIDIRFEGEQKAQLEQRIRDSFLFQKDGTNLNQADLRRELEGKDQKGVWIRNNEGFIFLGIGPEDNSAYAEYDSTAGVLHFLMISV